MHGMGKTVNELHFMLKLHEETLPKKEVSPMLHALRAGRIQKNNKNKKPLKVVKGKDQRKGNSKLSYAPKPKIPPQLNKDNPTKDRSKKLNPGALNLYVGNGHCESVEATGTFHLCLPSGLVVVLNNCHYASPITRGIISVSLLYENGFVNRFKNNGIYVSKDNSFYFHVIPRDGIYEIDLHYSNINDSYVYDVSNKIAKLYLDSTLLWHCLLGHINKKRIEKLQHDGLFKSTDDESFDKCLSYLSEKMTRYPKEEMGYSLYYPPENKVIVAQNNELFKNSLITQEASRSLEDLEVIQDKDLHSSKNTSLHHDEDEQEPQSDVNLICRSTRTRHAPDQMCLYVDVEEHELGDHNEPTNYKVALSYPKSRKWIDATNVEMKSMKDNQVRDLVDLPPNGKIVGGKWFFKNKTGMDGKVHTYKAQFQAWTYPDARNPKLSKAQGASTPNEVKRMQRVPYSSAVGFIIDIKRELRVTYYTDARYLIDVDDSESQTRYVFILNRGTIRKFIYGLGVVPTNEEPMKMYCDTTKAISIANEPGITKGEKHYHTKVHCLREVIELGDIKLDKVHTYDNVANSFTKALPF
nr:hypothetical protein [Tanacetum cinerariifolium]